VLSFLTTNDLVAFGVQLTAVSLGFKGLQVAAAALTSLNVASWFTATAVGAKVTSIGMAAATVTTGGLTGAIKALTLAMAKNPLTLLILAGTAAAIAIGNAVIEQKKLNDEVQKSLDIAAKAPASDVAKEINATENALRKERSKIADALKNPGFEAARLIPNAEVERLEAKLLKLNKTYKVRIELETIFKGLGAIPEGYKVVNGRLAYLSPGQGYLDAESGELVPKGRSTFPGGGGEDGGEKAGASLLKAIEQREEALLNLRTQREEQLAQIREQAIEQAKQIETQLADKRLAIERQIQDIKRQSSDFIEDSERRIRAARGEDSDLIAAEQKVVDIFREERDAKLDSERRLADDKKQQEETIADFQRGVAKSINAANRAHTRSMGEIQKQYANSVAKIIDEGTGKAGKRLAAAAQLAALYIQRGTLNSQIAATAGVVIPARRQGGYNLSDVGIGQGIATPQSLKEDTTFKGTQVPVRVIIDGIDPKIEKLQRDFNLSRTPARTPGIGDQFTALLGAEGGYEDVAGIKPLPVQRMQQQAARPFLELWKTWESFSNNVFGPSKEEINRVTKPDPARNKQVLERIQRTQTAIDNYDPVEAKWKEIDNKLREVKRSKPATMSAASLVSAVESIYTDLGSTVRRAGGLAVKAGERLGSMLDFSDYASPQQSQVIGKGIREVLGRAYERSIMFGGDKNAFSAAIDQLAPLTRKFGGLIEEVLQIEARKGYVYAEKALPRLRLAPTPAARPEERQYMMDRLDRMYEQPYITPGIQNRIEGASLFGTGFDVSKIATDFGQIASASFIGGLLAQNSGAPRPYRVGDTIPGPPAARPNPVIPSAEATTQLRNTQAQTEEQERQAKTAQLIEEAFADVNREGAQFTNGLNEQLQLLEDQRTYLDMGFSDSLSSDLANVNKTLTDSVALARRVADQTILGVQAAGGDPTAVEAAYEREIANLGTTYALNIKITQELEKQAQALRIRQDERIGLGMQEGVQSYLESIGTMRQATEELTVNGIKGVENAIFDLVTTGTTNFREFAADILRQTARMIIQQLVLRNVMLIVKSAFGFADGGVFAPNLQPTVAPSGYAMGGTFAKNNIIPYAKGGTFTNSVVSKPTLFKFAAGGTMQTGVMGEAGPEAIMPLSRGANGKLGVSSSGGGGGTTNVTVNVDATGSKAQGDSGKSEQLGRAVSQAVQDELLKQRRPGGLLA
jgi:lambda family phage tail tape measure protein